MIDEYEPVLHFTIDESQMNCDSYLLIFVASFKCSVWNLCKIPLSSSISPFPPIPTMYYL